MLYIITKRFMSYRFLYIYLLFISSTFFYPVKGKSIISPKPDLQLSRGNVSVEEMTDQAKQVSTFSKKEKIGGILALLMAIFSRYVRGETSDDTDLNEAIPLDLNNQPISEIIAKDESSPLSNSEQSQEIEDSSSEPSVAERTTAVKGTRVNLDKLETLNPHVHFLSYTNSTTTSRASNNKKNKAHDQAITSVSFSKDGLFLVSSSLDGKIRLWDITSKQLIKPTYKQAKKQQNQPQIPSSSRKKLPFHGAVFFSPDWASTHNLMRWYFAIAGENKIIKIFYLAKEEYEGKERIKAEKIGFLNLYDSIYSLSIAPNQQDLAVGTSQGRTMVYTMHYDEKKDVIYFIHKMTMKTSMYETTRLSFSYDSQWLVSGGKMGGMKVWAYQDDSHSNMPIFSTEGRRSYKSILALGFAQDEHLLAISESKHDLHFYNLENAQQQAAIKSRFTHNLSQFTSILFITSHLLALGLGDGSIEIWYISSDENKIVLIGGRLILKEANKHTSITALAFYQGTLAVGSSDGVIRLWYWDIERLENVLANTNGPIQFENKAP
ncbi:MAG: hypothetical protein AAF770_03135 [Bacteroidota bacterium]